MKTETQIPRKENKRFLTYKKYHVMLTYCHLIVKEGFGFFLVSVLLFPRFEVSGTMGVCYENISTSLVFTLFECVNFIERNQIIFLIW